MATDARPEVLVLGGGFGGLETAFYLRTAVKDRAKLTLVSDTDHFLFKPNTIYIPFGMNPEKLKIPLAKPTHRKDIDFIQATAREIDPERKTVAVGDRQIRYDYLVVATGAGMRSEEVPGLAEHAETIWTVEDMLRLRGALERLVSDVAAGPAPQRAVSHSAQQQVLRPALRNRPDAGYLAPPARGAPAGGYRLEYLRAQLHPGLRSPVGRDRHG